MLTVKRATALINWRSGGVRSGCVDEEIQYFVTLETPKFCVHAPAKKEFSAATMGEAACHLGAFSEVF